MNALDVFADACPDVEVGDGVLDAIAAEVFDGTPRRTGGDARWRLLAVAAAVVALVAGLALVVGRPDAPSPADTVPPVIPDDGEPLRMLPSNLDGSTVIGFLTGREQSSDRSTVLALPMPDGSYTDKVVVRRGPIDELSADIANFENVEPFSKRGRTWDVVSDAELGWVFAQSDLGDGTAMTVAIETTDDVERSRAIVVDVATSLANVTQPPLGVAFDPLPAGFEVIAEWGISNSWVRYASVHEADGSITKAITHANDDPFLAARLMGDDLRPVQVRGTVGFATRYLDTEMIVWEETPGQWVVVESATGDALGELIEFAESLRVVSAAEWDRVVELPGDMAGTSATTAPALPGTVPSATTAPGLPGTVPPATSAPQPAPPGRLLVANASMVGGVAGLWSASLESQGANVLDATNAMPPDGVAATSTRVYARPGFEVLGRWVAEQFGDVAVEPFDALDPATIDGDVTTVDVIAVVGSSHANPALRSPGAPLVIGNSVTMGAEAELAARGYLVNAEPSRQLIDVVGSIREVVQGGRSDVLILQLADNGPVRRPDLDALLEAASDVPNIIVVNTHVDREWADPNNTLLAEVDEPGDNLILMDWDALADLCPGDCFATDGIHLTEAGVAYFVERLTDITGI